MSDRKLRAAERKAQLTGIPRDKRVHIVELARAGLLPFPQEEALLLLAALGGEDLLKGSLGLINIYTSAGLIVFIERASYVPSTRQKLANSVLLAWRDMLSEEDRRQADNLADLSHTIWTTRDGSDGVFPELVASATIERMFELGVGSNKFRHVIGASELESIPGMTELVEDEDDRVTILDLLDDHSARLGLPYIPGDVEIGPIGPDQYLTVWPDPATFEQLMVQHLIPDIKETLRRIAGLI